MAAGDSRGGGGGGSAQARAREEEEEEGKSRTAACEIRKAREGERGPTQRRQLVGTGARCTDAKMRAMHCRLAAISKSVAPVLAGSKLI